MFRCWHIEGRPIISETSIVPKNCNLPGILNSQNPALSRVRKRKTDNPFIL